MTKFNPDNFDTVTIGLMFTDALQVGTKEEAKNYLNDYAFYIMEKTGSDFGAALEMAKENIGYYARYYPSEIIEMVYDLFEINYPSNTSVEKTVFKPTENSIKLRNAGISEGEMDCGISFREFC
jgi:hypothetical protein